MSPVSILFVPIVSSRRLQDISSRHLQFISSRRLRYMSSRRLQDVFSVTIFRIPRRLEDVLEEVKLLRWRRAEDVFKTCLDVQDIFKINKCLLGRNVKYLLKRRPQNFDFLVLKNLSSGQFWGAPTHVDVSLNFKISCCNLKIRRLGPRLWVPFLLF